jgi:hypothetical protein
MGRAPRIKDAEDSRSEQENSRPFDRDPADVMNGENRVFY